MKKKFALCAAVLFSVLVAPAGAQQDATSKQRAEGQKNASPSEASKTAATTDPNYVIGAQDVLDINVWKEAELTRQVPVRPDGKISLPLLNDVQAAGATPAQLAMRITEGLKKYITDPQVTVIVTTINSQRIYILGEVNRAGAYPLVPGMTAVQALSSAGGFTPFAHETKIYIMRMEDGKQNKYPLNYKDVIKGKASDQLLKAGDTIVVP